MPVIAATLLLVGFASITIGPGLGTLSISRAFVLLGLAITGLGVGMIRLKDLTIAPRREAAPINAASRPVARLWLDGCRLQGLGATSSLSWWSGFEQTYCTDLHVSDNRDGLNGLLVRNVLIEDIGSDAFSNARFVVNATVRNIDRGGVDFHPDVYQLYGPSETFQNIIVYGLEAYDAKSQGIFARGLQGVKDSAFVNVLIELTDPIMPRTASLSPHTRVMATSSAPGSSGAYSTPASPIWSGKHPTAGATTARPNVPASAALPDVNTRSYGSTTASPAAM